MKQIKANFYPYEGTEQYIFVSYARKDIEQVIPLLEAMNRAGYRVWYDDGIKTGSTWTDSLAEHITKCAGFLPLISSASIVSEFCYKEIHYARDENKTIIPVYLEDVELSPASGLKLLLQGIQYRRLSDYQSLDDFLQAFAQEGIFPQCKRENSYLASLSTDRYGGFFSPLVDFLQKNDDAIYAFVLFFQENNETISRFIRPFHRYIASAHPSEALRSFLRFCRAHPYIAILACILIVRLPIVFMLLTLLILCLWGTLFLFSRSNFYLPEFTLENKERSLALYEIPDGFVNIGDRAFYNHDTLTQIEIPHSIRKIGKWSFSGCKNLSGVLIPDSVTEIGAWAFENCVSLTHITLPDSMMKLSCGVFSGCVELDNVSIPKSVKEIDDWAFENCVALKSIVIPDDIVKLGCGVFSGCVSLSGVTIPANVTEIGNWAFRNCSSLMNLTFPESVTKIGDSAFTHCASLTSITLPNSVKKIGHRAFRDCPNLNSVSVPASADISPTAFDRHTQIIYRE